MEIEIGYCNNIDHARISLVENKLNIKFAPNGTGKSTLAKAIQYSLDNDGSSLVELTPFKLRETNPENITPQVIGVDTIESVMCFNENYVSQIVFKPDELVNNSFDIFIRNETYKELEGAINNLISKIKNLFLNNPKLEILISNLKDLSAAFKLTKTGISKTSSGIKCLSGGNKIQHIPPNLEAFSSFIQSEVNVSWIDWQIKGYSFLDLSDSCPFCTSDTSEKKETIKQVGEEYNKSVIKNLVELIDVIASLGDYFTNDAKAKLTAITTLKNGLEREHEAFLFSVKTQIDNFVGKLETLRTLSGFEFKEGEEVSDKLQSYKLDLDFFSELNSDKTQEAIASINASIDELIQEAGVLKGKINRRRREVQKVIARYQNEINDFLTYAGYKYKVKIAGEDGKSQLKLLHIDYSEHLNGGNQHLSFGERNAFSIILFMYECLSKNPDLIILDDPISSFDKNKKYAILEMLFRRDHKLCLKSKTVLMLTHDIEPLIDTLKSLGSSFRNQTSATFLKYSCGTITEVLIEKDDIQPFPQICKYIFTSDKHDIVKLIYLRRYYEIIDDKGDVYQVLSNLFHKRPRPLDSREDSIDGDQYPEMEEDKFEKGCTQIKNDIEGFEYQFKLRQISDSNILETLYNDCQNGYEKLQIFRLFELSVNNSVIQKFINETYHIENEFICQLNPDKFDVIPEYVVEECNRHITQGQAENL